MGRTHPNLVGHWRFENNLTDTSGNGNNAQADIGTPAYIRGRIGQGRSYNGANSDRVPHSASLDTVEITITFWARRTGAFDNLDYFLGRPVSPTPTQVPYRFYFNQGVFNFGFFNAASGIPWVEQSNNATDSGGVATTQNVWYHYAGVIRVSGSQWIVEIWRDGVLINSVTTSTAPPIRTSDLFIGAEDNRRFFDGDIDDLQIWNRALAPHQIAAIYNGVDPAFIGDVA